MLRFILRKTLNKRWLALALLIGNLLLIAIAASSPMYTQAALQRMLTNDLGDYVAQNEKYPTVIQVYGSSTGGGSGAFDQDLELLTQQMPEAFGVEPMYVLQNLYLEDAGFTFAQARTGTSASITGRLGFLSGMEDHVTMLSGRLYADSLTQDGAIEVVISQKCMVNLNLLVGDELVLNGYTMGGEPMKLRVVGVYTNSDPEDAYWYKGPGVYYRDLMMDEGLFKSLFMDATGGAGVRALMFLEFDYRDFQARDAAVYLQQSAAYKTVFKEQMYRSYTDHFSDIIEAYQVKAARVTVTLRILQVPIYALLCAFMFMVSRQMLELEANEISVIKSRGAAKKQIIGLYTIQSLILAGLGLVLGLPFAMLLCQMVGSANAFLEFVSRQALHVTMDSQVLLYALAAAVLSLVFMVLPVFRYADVTIVGHKQSKSGLGARPLWQRLFLDVVCLGVSLYGLYSYNGQKAALAQKVQAGAGLDPLLFLCSSLFIIGAGLFCLRLIPLLVSAVYRIGKKHWSPPLYTALLYVIRTKNSQGHILVFLVVTIALGIFNAQTARTINQNEADRITYTYGADIVLQEPWKDNSFAMENDPTGMLKIAYTEPDYGRYQTLAGAQSVTKVVWDEGGNLLNLASATGTASRTGCTIVGIDAKEFGQTADFKTSLLDTHWYNYLNAMSQTANAILVSSNLKTHGYELGDVLTYKNSDGNQARGVIYGFVDYFPGFVPSGTETTRDGETVEYSNFLVVANLGYLQAQWGVTPYQVWIRAADSTDFIYDFAAETGTEFVLFRDARAALIDVKNDPVIQGTNGILTVGFVVVLALCAVGFLIYWVLSVTDRALQFGIYRAMGMSMKEIIAMLLCEQVCISGLGVAAGVGVGVLASRLYIPLVQIAYASADTVIPLEVTSSQGDMLRLLIAVAIMILVCMAVLGVLIRRIQISQALKLGED